MAEKRIEERFRNALENYDSRIDDDQLWADIESRVPKKKKKRSFLFWFFLLPIILFSIFGGMHLRSITTEDVHQDSYSDQGVEYVEESNGIKTKSLSQIEGSEKSNLIYEKNETTLHFKEDDESEAVKESEANSMVGDRMRVGDNNKKTVDIVNTLFDHSRIPAPTRAEQFLITDNQAPLQSIDDSHNAFRDIVVFPNIAKRFNQEIPFHSIQNIVLKVRRPRNKKEKKPKKAYPKFMSLQLNYYAGVPNSAGTIVPENDLFVDYGEDYFAQGLALEFDKSIWANFYGKLSLRMDQSFWKYEDVVSRDTLVPSSAGEQVLALSEYANGIIDTEFGIPIVRGDYQRDVLHLNKISTVAIGIGIGYIVDLGKMNLNAEAEIQRTMYYGLAGLGRRSGANTISDLESFGDYFSFDSKYALNTAISMDIPISKSISISTGFQYQYGLSSMLNDQVPYSEKLSLFRGSVGLVKRL